MINKIFLCLTTKLAHFHKKTTAPFWIDWFILARFKGALHTARAVAADDDQDKAFLLNTVSFA